MNIAINGFGRIGKNFFRTIYADPQVRQTLRVKAINIGSGSFDDVPYFVTYDTLMGTSAQPVQLKGDTLYVADHAIKLLAHKDPLACTWGDFDIDWVVDCTGAFTKAEDAALHLQAGARFVLISAPAQGEDVSIIPGINDALFDPHIHKIVSLGSCTTNAFLPMLKVLHEQFGVAYASMTTTHAYTNGQALLDAPAKDLRRSRAAALNIIPTSTGVAQMVQKVMPELGSVIDAIAIRVPVGKGSLIDLVVNTKKSVSAAALNEAFVQASQSSLKGILAITDQPIVSSDCWGTTYSVIIDGLLTRGNGTMAKVFGWYDNEWGYSMRLRDFLCAQKR
jgi:glyceraldehyde 3-phosphate dehydrogenase